MTAPTDFHTRMAALDFATKVAGFMDLKSDPGAFMAFVVCIEGYLRGPSRPSNVSLVSLETGAVHTMPPRS